MTVDLKMENNYIYMWNKNKDQSQKIKC